MVVAVWGNQAVDTAVDQCNHLGDIHWRTVDLDRTLEIDATKHTDTISSQIKAYQDATGMGGCIGG